jgi:hypothetical protein
MLWDKNREPQGLVALNHQDRKDREALSASHKPLCGLCGLGGSFFPIEKPIINPEPGTLNTEP